MLADHAVSGVLIPAENPITAIATIRPVLLNVEINLFINNSIVVSTYTHTLTEIFWPTGY